MIGGYSMSEAERIVISGLVATDLLTPIVQLLAKKNRECAAINVLTVFSLAESDRTVILLENGKQVAQWSATDPDIERHVRTLIGEARPTHGI